MIESETPISATRGDPWTQFDGALVVPRGILDVLATLSR